MINPPANQVTPVNRTTEEWFDSIQSPVPPESPKSSRKRHALIGLGVLIFLALVGTVTALVVNQGAACLDVNDYKTLTGTELSDSLSPSESFYTEYVLFKTGSTDYDDTTDSGEHGTQLIQKIADFYKITANKSVIITVGGNYFVATAATEAAERVQTVKSSLLLAGVPESVLKVVAPTYIEPEDTATTTSETSIAITSASTCK